MIFLCFLFVFSVYVHTWVFLVVFLFFLLILICLFCSPVCFLKRKRNCGVEGLYSGRKWERGNQAQDILYKKDYFLLKKRKTFLKCIDLTKTIVSTNQRASFIRQHLRPIVEISLFCCNYLKVSPNTFLKYQFL